MKKLIVVFIALAMLLTCGCGAQKAEPTPEPSVEPTPEPTPVTISMDCAITDVLDADQQAFLSTLRSDPPAAAVVYLDGKYPETVILDLDTVRSICSAVSSLRVVSEVMETDGDSENRIILTRENNESLTLNFKGDQLVSLGSYYNIDGIEDFWALLDEACARYKLQAEENKAAMESGEFKSITYENQDAWKMRFTYSNVEPVGANDGSWQTIRTTLTMTNTGEHLIMSVKLIAKYLTDNGYVVAEKPVDLDFNAIPIYLGETRDYILDQLVYNPNGADSDIPAATDVIFTIVNINAPNEAGH